MCDCLLSYFFFRMSSVNNKMNSSGDIDKSVKYDIVLTMNNFNGRGGKGGKFEKSRGGNDRGGFGGRSKFGGDNRGDDRRGGGRWDRDDRPQQKFSAMCAACHKKCEVPFRPTGEKPVYCSDCFGQQSQGGSRPYGNERSARREERSDYQKPPRAERPARHGSQNSAELTDIKRQLVTIEARLNRILDIINPPQPAEKKAAAAPKRAKAPKATVDQPALAEVIHEAVEPTKVKKVAKKAAKKVIKKSAKKSK